MKWDLTKRKRASRKTRIVKCPRCGKYGQVAMFAGRSRTPKLAGSISHKGSTYSIGGMQGLMVDASCNLTLAEVEKIESWLRKEQ
jgi:hypothetical protein